MKKKKALKGLKIKKTVVSTFTMDNVKGGSARNTIDYIDLPPCEESYFFC